MNLDATNIYEVEYERYYFAIVVGGENQLKSETKKVIIIAKNTDVIEQKYTTPHTKLLSTKIVASGSEVKLLL